MKLKNYTSILTVVAGALLFMLIAFYNKFALVTSDSGAYIGNFYGNMLPLDRPIIYSFFIFFTSFHLSTFLVIFAQSVYLSYLIYLFLTVFFPAKQMPKISLFLFFILSFFTTLPWFSNQLMADIFTPMAFLAGFTYLFQQNLKKRTKYFLLFSFFLCGLMHNSNILVQLLFTIGLYLLNISGILQVSKQRVKTLIGISAFSIFLFLIAHFIGGYGFTMSRSSHVFLMGKMSENAVLQAYLKEHCTDENTALCAYKDQAPKPAWEFVWNPNSPHMQEASWAESKASYSIILKDIFFTPKYLWLYIKASSKESFIQFFNYEVGSGLSPYPEGTSPYNNIKKFYPNELENFEASRQNNNTLHLSYFNTVYYWFLILLSFVFLLLVALRKIKMDALAFALFTSGFLFLILNAIITASLANVLARLQSRAIWLIPLLFMISIIRILIQKEKATNR